MAISGQETLQIGAQNSPTNSDSLWVAFNKTQNNFSTLFSEASPYTVFNGQAGISVNATATSGVVNITNTGVLSLIQGTGITLSGSNGNIVISAVGGSNGNSGVTSVGISSTSLSVTNTPIVSSGNIAVELPVQANVIAGLYNAPTVSVDQYGRITNIANAASFGTVTSIAVVGNGGIGISGGPITSNGTITITNTGVTRLTAGSGIVLTDTTGNITITATAAGGGTANAAGNTGEIQFNLSGTLSSSSNLSYNSSNNTLTIGNMIATGNIIANNIGNIANINLDGNVSNVLRGNGTWGADANSAYGNSNVVTLLGAFGSNTIVTTGNANVGILSATGNISGGNLVLTTGNIIYTPRYGSFYSNATQTNPVANTAMAMTFNNTGSANGVSVTSNSRLTVAKAGTYNIQFSAQCTKTDAGTDYIEIWLSKNGTSVPWTNTRLKLDGSNVYQIASWNFIETLSATGYVQLMWGSSDLNAQIVAIPSANTTMGIDVPSVIVTVTPVGA
jgi:hypothetical protein